MKAIRRRRGDDWSPYGHEKARRRALMERHAYILFAAVAVAMLYGLFLQITLTIEDAPTSGGRIDIQRDEMRPITMEVSPGRAPAFMDAQTNPPAGIDPTGPEREQQPFLIRTIGPFLPLVAPLLGALWLLSRAGASARGKLAELNFGVYKGAMPLELHTARAHERVFTHREVHRHVFGKTAEDFLAGSYQGRPPLAVRRLLGDLDIPERATVTRLAHGRNTRAHQARRPARPSWRAVVEPRGAEVRPLRVPRPPPAPGWKGRLSATWDRFLDWGDTFVDRVADRLEPVAERIEARRKPPPE